MNKEIANWLRDSTKVATHLMNDFESLVATKAWMMQVMKGELQLGKQHITTPAIPSPQQSPKPLYQA
ncbi:hypothetical protein HYU40_03495 [Candidatus Woesearchaeota archaeon]|nr:hypothetical protein [Candidatus Woesearchaeota archaeon]